jgi:basic amino acid/polyamine antiporter, APA family
VRPYRVPFYPFVPLLFTGLSAYVLVSSVLYVGWIGCAISFGMLALGLVVRAGLSRWTPG